MQQNNKFSAFIFYVFIPLAILGWFWLSGRRSFSVLAVAIVLYSLVLLPTQEILDRVSRHVLLFSLPPILAFFGFISRPIFAIFHGHVYLIIFLFAFIAALSLSTYRRRYGGDRILVYSLLAFAAALIVWGFVLTRHAPAFVGLTGEGGLIRHEGPGGGVFIFRFFPLKGVIVGITIFTLFPIALLSLGLMKEKWFVRIGALGLAGLAVYLNLQMITRMAIVSGFVTNVVVVAFYFLREGKARASMALHLAAGVLAAVLVGWLFIGDHPHLTFFKDRIAQAPADPRTVIWAESIELILSSPLGDSRYELQSALYAHNLLLDFGLDHGIIGILTLLVPIIFFVRLLIRIALDRRFRLTTVHYIMLMMGVSHLFIMMIDPPVQTRVMGFLLPMFFLNEEYRFGARVSPIRFRREGREENIAPGRMMGPGGRPKPAYAHTAARIR